MSAQTPPKKRDKFTRKIDFRGVKKDVEITRSILEEALDPTLSTTALLIPGYNAELVDTENGQKVRPKEGTRQLKIYHLSPHYEKLLFAIAQPLFEEVEELMVNYNDRGGVKGISLAEGIPEYIQLAVHRLFLSVGDYGETLAKAASIVCEASITLSRKFKCEELTPQDHIDIQKLSPTFFMKECQTEYMLRNIVMPQYKMTGIAELVQVFFSKLKSMILPGLGSLIQQQTGSTTSSTPDLSKNLADLIASSTITLEPNLSSLPMEDDTPGTSAN